MKKLVILFLFSNFLFSQYEEDILGNNFQKRIINLNDDYEGKCISTIIKRNNKKNNGKKTAILYIHGYNDYFFQKHLAERINYEGYDFYAIDLRKYGRSHLDNQKWFNFRDISEYYPEIDSAINIIHKEGNENIIINAHSTGGLIISNYLNNRKNDKRIKLVLLNSPFFDFNMNKILKFFLLPFVKLKGKNSPNKIFIDGGKNSIYGRSIYQKYTFDTIYKKLLSNPINYGWLRGIRIAMENLNKSDINIPIVIFKSDKSSDEKVNNPLLYSSDIVLNVEDMEKVGFKLGKNIKIETIKEGIHDLSLSNNIPQEEYINKLIFYINKGYL